MGQLQDMMMRTQGVQGRASGANTPYGPPQSPPPMRNPEPQMQNTGPSNLTATRDPYASPGGQYADQMDPEMLAQIIAMMQATMGQAPMGSPQQGWMNPQQGPMQPSTPMSQAENFSRKEQQLGYPRNYSIEDQQSASMGQNPIYRNGIGRSTVDEELGRRG
jgi:hypothetical protein